jgi:hypothetical protein
VRSATTRLLSTSELTRSVTPKASTCSVTQTASAASSSNPPAKTASRSSVSRSGSLSRLKDQSTVAWRVCCLGIALRLPPVSSRKRWSSRSLRWVRSMEDSRAAASSSASGIPSRRRQIEATSGATASSSVKSRSWVRARSAKSRTASEAVMSSALSASGGGSDRDATRYTRSPSTPSGSLEVARMPTPGQPRTTWAQNAAASSTTCSQLSRTSSGACSRSAASSEPVSARPSVPATAAWICPPPVTGARSTNQTPSAVPSSCSAAACRARRVLPQPPAPASVTSREDVMSFPISFSSCSRPTNALSWPGRLLGSSGLSSEASGGKADGSASASSWKTCSGRPRSLSRCRPRSRSLTPSGSRSDSRSAVVPEMTTWPPWAMDISRAARLTTGPK